MVGQMLQLKLAQLDKVDRSKYKGQHDLEFELRLLLNILMNLILYNNDDPSLPSEFTCASLV